MKNGLGVNGAGYHDYEDVNPVASEEDLDEETLLAESEEYDDSDDVREQ